MTSGGTRRPIEEGEEEEEEVGREEEEDINNYDNQLSVESSLTFATHAHTHTHTDLI